MDRKRWKLATYSEVCEISANLRKEDFVEGFILRGVDPRRFIPENYNPGTTYVIFNSHGENVALAGCDPVGNRHGMIWMVSTPLLLNHQIEFLKYSKAWIEEVTRPFDLVGNMVHKDNEVHLKWLNWCGFTFISEVVAGKPPSKFLEFVKVIQPCA